MHIHRAILQTYIMQGLSKRTSKAKSSWWFQDSVFSGYMMCWMLPNNALDPIQLHLSEIGTARFLWINCWREAKAPSASVRWARAMLVRLGTILAIPALLPYPGVPLGDRHHRGPVAEQYPAVATNFRATSASLLARNKWIYLLYFIVIHLWEKRVK